MPPNEHSDLQSLFEYSPSQDQAEIEAILSDWNTSIRDRLIAVNGIPHLRLGPNEMFELLFKALSDPDQRVRIQAAIWAHEFALDINRVKQLRDDVVTNFCQMLQSDEAERGKSKRMLVRASLGDRSLIQECRNLLLQNKLSVTCVTCASILRDEESIKLLEDVWRFESSQEIKTQAAFGLAYADHRYVEDYLESLAKSFKKETPSFALVPLSYLGNAYGRDRLQKYDREHPHGVTLERTIAAFRLDRQSLGLPPIGE